MPMTTTPPDPRIALFDLWYFAAAEARITFADWRQAPGPDKRGAYAAYLAALDREEAAATTLERSLAGPPPRRVRSRR